MENKSNVLEPWANDVIDSKRNEFKMLANKMETKATTKWLQQTQILAFNSVDNKLQ